MFSRVSLSGCGWKLFWYYGVLQRLGEMGVIDPGNVDWITASAGGGVAIHFLAGLGGRAGFEEALRIGGMVRREHPRRTVSLAVDELMRTTPHNIHESGRITICYTRLSLWPLNLEYVMADSFPAKEAMADALRASTSIPLMNDVIRRKALKIHMDAGVLCNQPSRHHSTLRISAWPLSFGSDVRPQPSSLFEGATIAVPRAEVAEEMYAVGLRDGERFGSKLLSR